MATDLPAHTTSPSASDEGAPAAGGGTLEGAIRRTFHELREALELEPLGDDRFRATSERGRFGRTFGGQLLAQAVLAAATTVDGHEPDSLHAYFVGGGDVELPLDLDVTRVRDGRSTSIRRVEITQEGRPLLAATASLSANTAEPELPAPPPAVPGPTELPPLQSWVVDAPEDDRLSNRTWVDQPPPLDFRIGEAPYFMGGSHAVGSRSHWMRLPEPVTTDPRLQAALLTYASDYLLLDMAFRAHPSEAPVAGLFGTSLDHAIWLHRPVRFERWHLHTQELQALTGERALVRGTIHDDAGRLVASVAQEVLVRVLP